MSNSASFNESTIFSSYYILGNEVCNLVFEQGIVIVRDRRCPSYISFSSIADDARAMRNASFPAVKHLIVVAIMRERMRIL